MNHRLDLRQVLFVTVVAAGTLVLIMPSAVAQGGTRSKGLYGENMGRIGVLFGLYAADHDDRMPLSMVMRPTNTWINNGLIPTPADVLASSPWNGQLWINSARTMWRNSTEAYGAYPNNIIPGGTEMQAAPDIFGGQPNIVSTLMNGLLHTYPRSAIANPGAVPMLWMGFGPVNYVGRAGSTPNLGCVSGPCLFNPTGLPGPNANGASISLVASLTQTFWVYGNRTPMVFVDGSMRVVPVGTRIDPDEVPAAEAFSDPLRKVTSTGAPISFWGCNGDLVPTDTSGITYPCYFRPDRNVGRPLP